MELYSIEIFGRMDITNKKSVIHFGLNHNELKEYLGIEDSELLDSIIDIEF